MPKKVYFLVDICLMKQILLFGAGKSATVLIDYLLKQAVQEGWNITVVDADLALAASKVKGSPQGKAVSFDIKDGEKRAEFIGRADLVISMLPPSLHILVAKDCLEHGRHLLTASYVDDATRSLEKEISAKGLLFLCEMGLDPGIDHMSAMKLIDEIHEDGGRITSFQSHCGGLVAPESDDNPWHYKISWNPRNVVLAGKAGATYRMNGQDVKEDYRSLFRVERVVNIPDLGVLSWYPNRDSLSYAPLYGLEETDTFIRTTLRDPEFMYGWSNIIELNFTDETPKYETDGKSLSAVLKEHLQSQDFSAWLQEKMSSRFEETKGMLDNLTRLMEAEKEAEAEGEEIPGSFMSADEHGNLNEIELEDLKTKAAAFVAHKMHEANITLKQLMHLGMDDTDTQVNRGLCSAADILQFAMEKKISLGPGDRDMIVMMHEINYEMKGQEKETRSYLVVKGDDGLHTAMAKTVGLPLGIAAKLVLNGTIRERGLRIPISAEIYSPVLKELEEHGISFKEVKQ